MTAWRVYSDVAPLRIGARLVCEWHQARGTLYTGGLSKNIRVWDAEEEVCIQNIAVKDAGNASSLSVDPDSGCMLLAGFTKGVVEIYDVRLPETQR